ncbi:MAG TPA: carboxypeptidase regulatory-like domain-containing protein [Longimicrobium sp.]|jgi:hypothetical protein
MSLPFRGAGRLARAAAVAAGLLALPVASHAQEVVRLGGRVTRPDGAAAAGARVQVTTAAGQRFEARADSSGTYQLRLPGGASYVVSVESPGLNPATRVLARAVGDGEGLTVNFALGLRVVPLQPLLVRAPRLSVAAATKWTPGSVDQSRSGVQMREEPLGSDHLSDLAARQVGIAHSPTPDGPGVSIAGQAPDQTHLTLDGASFGSGLVPREAIRSVEVITNTFDVARGRFTGGQLDVRTQHAGNEWGATVRLEGLDPRLQYGDVPEALQRRATHRGVDAGAGGALVRDRVFAFGAFTLRRTAAPVLSLGDIGLGSLQGLGVSPDSLRRFLEVTAALRPEAARLSSSESEVGVGLVRLDAVLSRRHALTLRMNGQRTRQSDDGSLFAVEGTGSRLQGSNYGVLAQLGSGGARVANEFKLHLSNGSNVRSASDPVPVGEVNVASSTAADASDVAVLRFAGNPFAAGGTRQRSFELSDQLVVMTPGENHRLRVGGEFGVQQYTWLRRASYGSFAFSSLHDLELGRPALFTRSLDTAERNVEGRRAALFMDDRWRAGGLQLSYGIRAERFWYPGESSVHPAVETRFARAPGMVPSPWRLSPRVGFAFERRMPWDRGPQGKTALQGGIGEFVGVVPLPALGAGLYEAGPPRAAELVCIGPAAPAPDWAAFRAGPEAIPLACADGSATFASRQPRVTLFAPDFAPPRVWRASLNGQGLLSNGVIWNFTAAWLRGVNQPMAFDRNLRAEPAFFNTEEGGRPVYVGTDAIDPGSGQASLTASRRFAELGTVREVTGGGRSRTVQLSAKVSRFFGQARAETGYTWTDARQTVGALSAPGAAFASTAGDPLRVEWSPAPYTPRHMLQGFAEWRRSAWLTLSVLGRLASGTPFTPMSAGDVNGDGARNDRAYIFGSAAADEVVARGMEELLRDAPPGVRSCLRAQAGSVAAHNSCSTGWSPSLDLNARFQFGARIDDSPHRRVTVWLAARNVTSGLDYLVHGPDDLRGWGQLTSVDNTLLTVRGFDPESRRFRYSVNPRFGRATEHGFLNRAPFTISLQARVVLGTDRVLTAFRKGMNEASGRDQALSPPNVRLHLQRQLPNLPAEVLLLDAPRHLYLTPAQAKRLQQGADSLSPRIEGVLDAFVSAVAVQQPRAPRTGEAQVRDLARQAVALRNEGAGIARSLLTPEQWAKLPGEFRNPGADFVPHPPQQITSSPDF